MDCRIVFVLLSFDVCVLEQLVGTYGFSARGMTILKGQIPQNTSVIVLKCRCAFGFLVAACSAHFGASKKGGPKTSIFALLVFLVRLPKQGPSGLTSCYLENIVFHDPR